MTALAIALSLVLATPPSECRTELRRARADVSVATSQTRLALERADTLARELAVASQQSRTATAWIVVGSVAAGLLVGALTAGLAVRYGD